MSRTLSVDPGIRACGVAVFDGTELTAAALIKNPYTSGNGPEEAYGLVLAVGAWLHPLVPDVSVIEVPRSYRINLQVGDQNDLIALAGVAYAVGLGVHALRRVRYFPRQWKGTIDPDKMIDRIEKRLTPAEKKRIAPCAASLRHNVIDAIGIGLKFLNRLEPRRVYPGASNE